MGIIKGFFSYIFHSLFISSVLSLSISVAAEELSKVNQEATNQTVQLLQDKSQRQAVIDSSDGAKKADNMAKEIFGEGAELEEAYAVAAELFKSMSKNSKGDSTSMMEIMGNAQKNPEQFFKTLTPEQQKMIQQLGQKAQLKKRDPAQK